MVTTATPQPFSHLYDMQGHQLAHLRDLDDMQSDLLEALDGLTWQQERKRAELARAQEDFREIAAQRAECLYDDSTSDRLRRNEVMARTSLAQLRVATVQQQIDYLEQQIAGTRRKLVEIRDEIVSQRKGLHMQKSATA